MPRCIWLSAWRVVCLWLSALCLTCVGCGDSSHNSGAAPTSSGQVAVLVAEMLGIAALTTAVAFEYADSSVTVRREIDVGLNAVVKA